MTNVLHISYFDTSGGAAIAAYRLHQGLRRVGVGSEVLVQRKLGDDDAVYAVNRYGTSIGKIRAKLDAMPLKLYPDADGSLFSPAWVPFNRLATRVNSSNVDVVHLHWITAGMLNIGDLLKIKKPIVWSLHDMWPFTGGCHYDAGCGRYESKCGSCPILGSRQDRDLSRRCFVRKEDCYSNVASLTVVGLSRWLAECARKSPLMKGHEVVQLPNPIDLDVYRPMDKETAREMVGLPIGKKIVLFGAVNATEDRRKGFDKLVEALSALPPDDDVELAVFGADEPANPPSFGFRVNYLGRIIGDDELRCVYSAADMFVAPSLQENLSNGIIESMACGTPVIAFDVGGNGDIITHRESGYLARPWDPSDLAEGIKWVLESSVDDRVSEHCRETVAQKFEMTRVAQQYRGLYERILRGEIN